MTGLCQLPPDTLPETLPFVISISYRRDKDETTKIKTDRWGLCLSSVSFSFVLPKYSTCQLWRGYNTFISVYKVSDLIGYQNQGTVPF